MNQDLPKLIHYTPADLKRSRRLSSTPMNLLEIMDSLVPSSQVKNTASNQPMVIEPTRKYSATETFIFIYGFKPTTDSQLRQRLYGLRQKGLKAIRLEKEFHYLGSSILNFININEE